MRYGVIMAGGSGKRLWPLSRGNTPKQLLPVAQGKSLLRLSFERLNATLPAEQIYVCTGEQHREAILADLTELPPENLLGEPEPRDTANAVGFPAAVLAKNDPDAVFAVVTADHVIKPVDTFVERLNAGFDVCEKHPNLLVTFGVVPTHGHTGLGYVQRSNALDGDAIYSVQAFKEKPDKPTADRYVESGRYYWNSGMFVWRASTVLDAIKEFLPESHKGLAKIADAWGTDQQADVLGAVYPTLPKISIDYAVMEPASRRPGDTEGVAVVELPVSWLDVGSWPALAETLEIDDFDNAVDAPALAVLDSDANIILSRDEKTPDHLIALIGVSDTVVVHTADCTLVCPKSEAQKVKELVDGPLKERFGDRYV
ncbi:MAG: mannose-1-phosphate guanylyltransferase [Planctomycetota bacterium]